ncbi:thermonuclease family protein [Knoellia locipacati]|uniref:thermonuclease family protein n=1 Tax=Knoellia locipacati TaxID=882824 RepID=UPI00384F00AA
MTEANVAVPAGRRMGILVACLIGLALTVLGATGVVALTGTVRPSDSTDVASRGPERGPAAPGDTSGPSATPSWTSPGATSTSTVAPSSPTPGDPGATGGTGATPTGSTGPSSTAAPRTPRPVAPPAGGGAGAFVPVVGVTDGDTIRVRVPSGTERVRLIGLDAPERKGDECWSQQAASRLQSLVQSRTVQLVADPTQADRDRYGRLLRHVVTEDGQLAAQVLIEGGFAKEYTYAAAYEHRDTYLAAQKRAQTKRLGVWSAACAAPTRARPAPAATPAPGASAGTPADGTPASGCVIKGNISSSGERIYHVPGGGSYDDTVISPGKGERWFCTEQDALDAGWRKALN